MEPRDENDDQARALNEIQNRPDLAPVSYEELRRQVAAEEAQKRSANPPLMRAQPNRRASPDPPSGERLLRWIAAMGVLAISCAVFWALFARGVIHLPSPSRSPEAAPSPTATVEGKVTVEKNGVRVEPEHVHASILQASLTTAEARELLTKELDAWNALLPMISSYDHEELDHAKKSMEALRRAIAAAPATGYVPTRTVIEILDNAAYSPTLLQLKLTNEHRADFEEKHPMVLVSASYYPRERDEAPGKYMIEGISPGSWLLQCYADDERYGNGTWLVDVTLKAGENIVDLDPKSIANFYPN
jgi:hypothetical protein